MAAFSYFILLTSYFTVAANADNAMTLTSPAFKEGENIPEQYTCDGKNISPALRWTPAPARTQEFRINHGRPDAVGGLKTHWVLFNIPPTINNLPQGLPPIRSLANMEQHGTNSFDKLGYAGPCPPEGAHRYYFRFYALDSAPVLDPGVPRTDLLKSMEGHVLAEAQLMGKYQRKSKV